MDLLTPGSGIARRFPEKAWGVVPLILGAALGRGLSLAPHGYAAAYDFIGFVYIATVAALAGAILVISSRTRSLGRAALGASLLFALGFLGTWGCFEALGAVEWRQARPPIAIQ